MRIGIIGGTGVYELGASLETRARRATTPYGAVELLGARCGGHEVVFLARHGPEHSIPPHKINYQANVDALRRCGCECVLATNAVGSMRPIMQPGDFVLPDQFLDFTKGRAHTFYNGGSEGVRHVDVTAPYCRELRDCALRVLREEPVTIHPAGVYVCTEGPRFETPAEIRMFAQLGGDVVGMTGVPEVALAREAGLCYLSICVVTNFAAGVKREPLTEGEVTQLMRSRLPLLREVILRLVEAAPEERACGCRMRRDAG